jgi:hypothetical protein
MVALVPRPRVNLTRFHGVFAPSSTHRGLITPAQRGKGRKDNAPPETQKTMFKPSALLEKTLLNFSGALLSSEFS